MSEIDDLNEAIRGLVDQVDRANRRTAQAHEREQDAVRRYEALVRSLTDALIRGPFEMSKCFNEALNYAVNRIEKEKRAYLEELQAKVHSQAQQIQDLLDDRARMAAGGWGERVT